MPNYSQWYVEATSALAREAFRRLMLNPSDLWVYYKPNGLAFALADETEGKPEGYTLLTGERIPGDLTVMQLTSWIRYRAGSVPVLPGD